MAPIGAEVLAPLVVKAPVLLVAEMREPHNVEELVPRPIESSLDGMCEEVLSVPDAPPRALWYPRPRPCCRRRSRPCKGRCKKATRWRSRPTARSWTSATRRPK